MDETEKEKTRAYYVKCWTLFLTSVLGWQPEQINRWMKPYLVELEEYSDAFLNDSPVFYAADAVVPQELQQRLQPLVLHNLHKTIAGELDREERKWMREENYDWTL